MSDHETYSRIRPKSRKDRLRLISIVGYALLAMVLVAGLFYLKHKYQADMEQNWNSAVATIEDVRTRIAMQANSQGAGAMFYDVQVLAKYTVDGAPQERWITVQQMPKLLADAQFQAFRWKGQKCFVRGSRWTRTKSLRRSVDVMAITRALYVGPSALRLLAVCYLGLRPRLICAAPLALGVDGA